MNAKSLYLGLIAVVTLLCLGFIGVGYATNKVLGAQATKLSNLKGDSAALQTAEITLSKNKADVVKYSDLNTIAQTIVPQDKDQAEGVREIVKLAGESGISKLSSITFPSSTLGTVAPGAGANPNLTQLTPVLGTPGVYELPITIAQDSSARVPYSQFIAFLTRLEQNRRTAQVSNISIQPDTANPGNVAFTLVINEFIKP